MFTGNFIKLFRPSVITIISVSLLVVIIMKGGNTVLAQESLLARTGPIEGIPVLTTGNSPSLLEPLDGLKISFQEIASGLANPIFIANAGDGSGRIFIVEQTGTIRILKNGTLLGVPFLDIHTIIKSGGEQGLLALAFHPSYSTNGIFFVAYTAPRNGDATGSNLVLEKFSVSPNNPDLADPASGVILLTISHPVNSNHNGGTLAFGGDGYLYWSTGDGGSGGDPANNAQQLNSLLGKILRIDVNTGSPYGIPTSNPFYSNPDPNVKKEIWAYGLRNPWRFSFDKLTHDLYIGDVGQSAREEVDFQSSGSTGGENYGWRVMEGSICYNPSSGCDQSGKVLPVAEYNHTLGCSITGGYVYRGLNSPSLTGYYFYGDVCSGRFFSLYNDPVLGWTSAQLADTPYAITTFGEDEQGELYLADYGAGKLYNIHYQEPFYTISGTASIAGAILFYIDGTTKTVTADGSGNYSITVPSGWSGTVTPDKAGYAFTPAAKSYGNVQSNQTAQDYTVQVCADCANINILIGGTQIGAYTLGPLQITRQNYTGVDSGPVKVESTNGVPIIAAIRDAWAVNGVTTSFSQLMGLPLEQLSNKYVFPGYNNVTLNEQLRIANVDTVQTTVTVRIDGVLQGTYTLYPPGSLLGASAVRINYPGLDSGPVVIEGTAGVNIIAAIREAWAVNGVTTSFIQLMGLPAGQLSNKYVFPAYNNVTLNEQLRIANVDTEPTTVTVTIGGVLQGTYTLYPPGSPLGVSAVRVNYAGLDSGPVIVEGTPNVKIISAIRDAWAVNGVTTSFSQLMGMPAEQLSNKYLFPAYNNVTLNEQLRISNVDSVPSTVTVTIGGVPRGTYTLYPPGSPLGVSAVRINYAGLDSGPVVVEGTAGVDIISAIREAWAVNGVTKSFVQLMGLPAVQLSTTFLFPAYNNVTLNEQLRFGVP